MMLDGKRYLTYYIALCDCPICSVPGGCCVQPCQGSLTAYAIRDLITCIYFNDDNFRQILLHVNVQLDYYTLFKDYICVPLDIFIVVNKQKMRTLSAKAYTN